MTETLPLVTFSEHGETDRPGVIDGDAVRAFDAAIPTLASYIALGETERAAARARLDGPIARAGVTLRAPLRPQKNVFCIGRNYVAHVDESIRARGDVVTLPTVPVFFTKAPTAIAGPDEDLRLSDVSTQHDWEGELAAVIGVRCRDVAEADALDAIFGYTCLNDITARDVQYAHGQWFKGKSLDASCPIGPWIVPAAAITNPQALAIALRVNGVEKQRSSTASMIFPIARIVAELSRGLTLEPGDIIATGTPEGVGFARTPPEFLRDGDRVEVEIEGIGILRNVIRIPARVARG